MSPASRQRTKKFALRALAIFIVLHIAQWLPTPDKTATGESPATAIQSER